MDSIDAETHHSDLSVKSTMTRPGPRLSSADNCKQDKCEIIQGTVEEGFALVSDAPLFLITANADAQGNHNMLNT